MSEGAITYQSHGETCGITTVINSQLRNHRVCEDGLACVQTTDSGGSSTGKQCRSLMLIEGDRCSPVYDSCFGSLNCILNMDDYYTCGGAIIWDGNEPYVDTGYIQASEFKIHIPLVVCGVVVIIIYMLLLVYICLYENNKGRKEVADDGCFRKSLLYMRNRQ
jgi:hypothetical protein